MTKPDIIICWPKSADYPLWRSFVKNNRDRFNKIIVVFTETNHGHDYREFVKEAMALDQVTFIDSRPIQHEEDWRDVATNMALELTESDWIWFTEQDFFPRDGFWNKVEDASAKAPVVGVKDGVRLHPCSLFMRRETINGTKRNFGIVPGKSDHFGLIAKDLETYAIPTIVIDKNYYYHMAGLSHNFRLLEDGGVPNHKLEDFQNYLTECLLSDVKIDPGWKLIAEEGLKIGQQS